MKKKEALGYKSKKCLKCGSKMYGIFEKHCPVCESKHFELD